MESSNHLKAREEEEEEIETSLLIAAKENTNDNDFDHRNGHSGDSSSVVTPLAVFSTCVAVMGSFTYGYATGFSSPAEAGIMKDVGLTLSEYSVFASIMTLGAMLGALSCGTVADLIGRRGAMWLAELFCIIGWLSVIFFKEAWLLDFGRLSSGIGIGLHCYVAPVYIGEIAPKNIRGACTVANLLILTFGLSLIYFIGNIATWKTLAIIGIVPCLLQVLGLFFVPESPRWLASVGKEKRFEGTLQLLRGVNTDISEEAAQVREFLEISQNSSKSRFLDLFNKRYTHALTIAFGIPVLVQLGGAYAIASYTASILEAADCPPAIGSTALAISQLFFAALGLILTDISGRRPLWMISSAGTCLGNSILAVAFILQGLHQSTKLTAALAVIGILVFSSFFSIGMSGTQFVIMSEILPSKVKGSAGTIVIFFLWFASWFTTYTFNFLFEWSKAGTFIFYAIMCGSTVLFVGKLMPETKGRSLEEIQTSWNSS